MYKSQGGQQQRCPSAFMKSYEQNLSGTIALHISPRVKVDTSAESYNASQPQTQHMGVTCLSGMFCVKWHMRMVHTDHAYFQ